MKTIQLYSTNSTLRRYIRDSFTSARVQVVEHCGPPSAKSRVRVREVNHHEAFLPLPDRADMVVTLANPTLRVEWLAARLGTYVACLPEAEDWLRGKLDKVNDLILVGAEQAR